jgi:hypothetical protein
MCQNAENWRRIFLQQDVKRKKGVIAGGGWYYAVSFVRFLQSNFSISNSSTSAA